VGSSTIEGGLLRWNDREKVRRKMTKEHSESIKRVMGMLDDIEGMVKDMQPQIENLNARLRYANIQADAFLHALMQVTDEIERDKENPQSLYLRSRILAIIMKAIEPFDPKNRM
jgi:dTDP-4-amino-4,6-dideoxygalactose transaminase